MRVILAPCFLATDDPTASDRFIALGFAMQRSDKSRSQVREPRALTEEERALIQWMLSEASAFNFIEQLAKSSVISGCDCGCASVHLEVEDCPAPTGGLRIIGDFVYGDESSLQGAFVFERDGVLAGLEVYGLTIDAPTRLPSPTVLRP